MFPTLSFLYEPISRVSVEINSQEINERGRKILDYASDSSTDDDMPTISNTWRGYEMDNSDNESVDSQNEDLLK